MAVGDLSHIKKPESTPQRPRVNVPNRWACTRACKGSDRRRLSSLRNLIDVRDLERCHQAVVC
jgi:hypothetical protein